MSLKLRLSRSSKIDIWGTKVTFKAVDLDLPFRCSHAYRPPRKRLVTHLLNADPSIGAAIREAAEAEKRLRA